MKRRTFVIIGLIIALTVAGAILLYLYPLYSGKNENKDSIISIDYWTHSDYARNTLEERLIAEFEKANPGIRINRTIYTSSELLNILPNAISAGRGPVLFNLQQDYLAHIIEGGYLSPADYVSIGYSSMDDVISDYIDDAFYGCTKDGVIYGIPMEFTNWCLYINKTKFREAGLDPETDYPKTWEEMVEVCEKLVSREDGILTERGFDFRYPHFLTFFVPMVQQLGGDILDENGNLAIVGEEAWEKAFSFMQEWGPLGRNLGSPTYKNARTVFNEGDIAMMLSGLYHEERLRVANPELFESGEWMVVPFPVFENGKRVSSAKYCHYWSVNASSSEKEQEAAWKFIGYLADHAEEYLEEACLLPPKRSIVDNLDSYTIPYSSVFSSDIEYSSFVYSGADAVDFKETIETLMKEVMLLGLSPEKAVIRLKIAVLEMNYKGQTGRESLY